MEDITTGLADERVVKILLLGQGRGLVRDIVTGREDWCGRWAAKRVRIQQRISQSGTRDKYTVGAG